MRPRGNVVRTIVALATIVLVSPLFGATTATARAGVTVVKSISVAASSTSSGAVDIEARGENAPLAVSVELLNSETHQSIQLSSTREALDLRGDTVMREAKRNGAVRVIVHAP